MTFLRRAWWVWLIHIQLYMVVHNVDRRLNSYRLALWNVILLLPEPPPNKVCFNLNLALYCRGWGCPHGRITTPLRRETLGKWKSIELYVSALNWGSKGILKNCTLSITRLFGRKNDGFFNVFTEFIFFPTDTLHSQLSPPREHSRYIFSTFTTNQC